ncbi:MAG: hypothetical protein ULS35scaffold63_62 [Phage 33_17]|nr:MAG: hypothetical protein ULS35scaffold63_62 [Phage 33_17]
MTLNLSLIKSHNPCQDGYATLLRSLNKTEADDEPLCLNHLLESNGVGDNMWVIFNCITGREMDKRNLLADIVESVEYIWDEEYPEEQKGMIRKWFGDLVMEK